MTGDVQLAEDLVQTALAKAWVAWPRVEGDPEPYVLRILTRANSSWWRRRSSTERPVDAMPEAPARDRPMDESLDLWLALQRLPARQRQTVVLRFILDLPEHRTADVLGCSIGTVKSQTSKALAKLRLDPSLAPTMEV